MNRIILDASIIIGYFVDSDVTRFVKDTIETLPLTHSVCVPEFAFLECANVLWKRVTFKGLSKENALAIFDIMGRLPLTTYLSSTGLQIALEIGIQNNLAIYDSIYIALAQQLDAPLYTLDARQARVARSLNIDVRTPF
jgi:predicted nucleic acid-binding protein